MGDEPVKRQAFTFSLALLMAVTFAGTRGVAAQEATPATPATPVGGSQFIAMGYQALNITVTDSAVLAPPRATAGLTLLTLKNNGPNTTNVTLISPKSGESIGDTLKQLATPVPNTDFPEIGYDVPLSGGPGALPGQVTEAIVNLNEGEYAFVTNGEQHPAILEVLAAETTSPPAPTADITVAMTEYAFEGMPNQITAGDHIIQFTNTGTQPHYAAIYQVPAGETTEQLSQALHSIYTGTPTAGATPSGVDQSFTSVGLTGVLSPGNMFWIPFNLPAGTYAMVCLVPDKSSGVPHAGLGMVQVFTVA